MTSRTPIPLAAITLTGRSGVPVVIDPPIALAPMAGVSDRPFRQLCRQMGAGLVVTEMMSAKPELMDTSKSRLRQIDMTDPEPRAVQLLGNEPNDLAAAARFAVSQGAQMIDLNLGCPAKKVCKKAAGSALMADPDTVARLLDALVAAVDCPVSLKMRTGPDHNQRNAVEIARIAENAGLSLLSIHGRTRADRYEGDAEYETIAAVVDAVSIPVLANGDITSPDKARAVLAHTGAAGIMVGRGAFGRPWLFSALRAELIEHCSYTLPDQTERFAIVRAQFEKIYQHYGSSLGIRITRKHLCWYADSLHIDDKERAVFNQFDHPDQQRQWLTAQTVKAADSPCSHPA
ncbi:MAG: tRNA dihydrouridine synthase DusB [Halothiobacillus sp.]|jgi:tRNA-dihydrouridine synthase B|nr:tRNA dihydrouridine synthase DusB [Halothiobacillus sp.]